MKKDLNYYASLEYPYEIYSGEHEVGDAYLLQFLDFDIKSVSEDYEEAIELAHEYLIEHIKKELDLGKELPNPGIVSWTNIEIDVNNVPVKNPLFVPAEESPACGSNAIVQQNEWVNITWNAV